MSESSKHYDKKYFDYQKELGKFGGWANQTKFLPYLKPDDKVLDFGCGGGDLLDGLTCRSKTGVEINPFAIEESRSKGITIYENIEDIASDSIDLVISDNALEHVLSPLEDLKSLLSTLRVGGLAVIVVPCESYSFSWKPNDVNNHLYTWSPMCLGNIMQEAGFKIIESKPYLHKWPPNWETYKTNKNREKFERECYVTGKTDTSWTQVRAVGTKVIQG